MMLRKFSKLFRWSVRIGWILVILTLVPYIGKNVILRGEVTTILSDVLDIIKSPSLFSYYHRGGLVLAEGILIIVIGFIAAVGGVFLLACFFWLFEYLCREEKKKM